MPDKVVWKLERHSLGKHKVLREYLHAWYPIMATTNRRILFIDGFAGPGEYEDGEPGSPIIALDAYLGHSSRPRFTAEIIFVFIEERKDRYNYLRELIENNYSQLTNLPEIIFRNNTFEETINDLLGNNLYKGKYNAPSFVMIDPFGISDTPMAVVKEIIDNDKTEIYLTFMYEEINRFNTTPEFEPHLDSLFGTKVWRDYINIEDPVLRADCLLLLYAQQLREAGASYVLKFKVFEGRRFEYAIFFASKHEQGADRMKKAIWKIAPWGDYSFRPFDSFQLTLGIETPNFEPLKRQLIDEFGGKGWVAIEEIELFMKSDKTPYHSGQLRKHALIPFEEQGVIQIQSTRKKRNAYPKGTCIRFEDRWPQ